MATFNPGHQSYVDVKELIRQRSKAKQKRLKSGAPLVVSIGEKRNGLFAEIDLTSVGNGLIGISREQLSSSRKLQKILLHTGLEAKTKVVAATQNAVKNDPREAWRSIRLGTFDNAKGLGAFVAIHDDRKSSDKRGWKPERKGTRGARSVAQRTIDINSYFGRSRAFILRFLNGGTMARYTNTRGRKKIDGKYYYVKKSASGANANRGRIRRMNFFTNTAASEMKQAGERFVERLAELIHEEWETNI